MADPARQGVAGPARAADPFAPFLAFYGLPRERAAGLDLLPEAVAAARGEVRLRRLLLAPAVAARLPGGVREVSGPLPPLAAAGGGGEPLALAEVSGRLAPVAVAGSGRARFGFDPAAALEDCLFERGRLPGPPLTRFLPFHYHRVPGALRVAIGRALTRLARPAPFPRWPEDPFAEALRALVREAIERVSPGGPPGEPFWPKGKGYAVALAHDVDDGDGQRLVEAVRAVERRAGVRSTFFFVTHRYPLDEALLARLRQEGCEVGAHGFNHDNRLAWLDDRRMEARLHASADRLAPWGGGGFRSPSKGRTDRLLERVARHFRYDSSCPDTDGRGGCATVFPFRRGPLLELPITCPLDADVILRGGGPLDLLAAWRAKVAFVKALSGLASITTHPEAHFGASPAMLAAYERFLEDVAADGGAWVATLGEVAEAWMAREERIAGRREGR